MEVLLYDESDFRWVVYYADCCLVPVYIYRWVVVLGLTELKIYHKSMGLNLIRNNQLCIADFMLSHASATFSVHNYNHCAYYCDVQ